MTRVKALGLIHQKQALASRSKAVIRLLYGLGPKLMREIPRGSYVTDVFRIGCHHHVDRSATRSQISRINNLSVQSRHKESICARFGISSCAFEGVIEQGCVLHTPVQPSGKCPCAR